MPPTERRVSQASLDVQELATAIADSAFWAYHNALSGAAAGRHTDAFRYFEWCTKPSVGQLVVEISARRKPAIDRVGLLEGITQEPVADWGNSLVNGPAPLLTTWALRGLDGQVKCWNNCQFIVAPSSRGRFSS